jgi:hypothetical protein
MISARAKIVRIRTYDSESYQLEFDHAAEGSALALGRPIELSVIGATAFMLLLMEESTLLLISSLCMYLIKMYISYRTAPSAGHGFL